MRKSSRSKAEIPWEDIYELVLNAGNVHDIKGFSIEVLNRIGRFAFYNQGRIYFYNGNGNINDQYLVGISENAVNAYHAYYSKLNDGKYAINKEFTNETQLNGKNVGSMSWDTESRDEFYRDYVRPLGIKHCLGFAFCDMTGNFRTYFMLDRTVDVPYSKEEVDLLNFIYPLLNNLHKNLCNNRSNEKMLRGNSWLEDSGLTKRETEIANLLCHGVKPANISKKLNITPSTVYKHITHIYEKLHVSSNQELLAKLLNN